MSETTTEATTEATTAKREYEKGTWQAALAASSANLDRSKKSRERASLLLWQGAKAAIGEWAPTSDTDADAEGLFAEVKEALGEHRKGDASKVKKVALAVRNHGLDLHAKGGPKNLSQAYKIAVGLIDAPVIERAEDDAADVAVASIARVVTPDFTPATPEDAAKVVLSQGVDEAARLLLDALGAENNEAHRAFLRALSAEVAGRVKPKVSAVEAGPKDGAVEATSTPKTAKAVKAGTKAKPGAKATPAKKAVPAKNKRTTANDRPLPPKGEAEADAADLFADETEAEAPAAVKAATKAKPVAVKAARA